MDTAYYSDAARLLRATLVRPRPPGARRHPPETVSLRTAAELLGAPVAELRRWIRLGCVLTVQVDGETSVPWSEVALRWSRARAA